MAISIKSRPFVLLLILVALLLIVNSEARHVSKLSIMGNKIKNKVAKRELINTNNVRRHSKLQPRRLMQGRARIQRMSPDGPDTQHH
ncbi:hypothetical protein HN51_011531 [Arachis hypogaea]